MAGRSLLSLLLQGIHLIIFSNWEFLSQAENSREYLRWQQGWGSGCPLHWGGTSSAMPSLGPSAQEGHGGAGV